MLNMTNMFECKKKFKVQKSKFGKFVERYQLSRCKCYLLLKRKKCILKKTYIGKTIGGTVKDF